MRQTHNLQVISKAHNLFAPEGVAREGPDGEDGPVGGVGDPARAVEHPRDPLLHSHRDHNLRPRNWAYIGICNLVHFVNCDQVYLGILDQIILGIRNEVE